MKKTAIKTFSIFYKTLMYAVAIFSCLVAIFTGILQSDWGKGKIEDFAKEILKEKGISVQYDSIDGILPFQWKIKNLELSWASGEKIFIQTSTFRPYLLRLLNREIGFRKIKSDRITIEGIDFESKKDIESSTIDISMPYSLFLNNMTLKNLQIENIDLNLKGRLFIAKEGKQLYWDMTATRDAFEDSSIRLRLHAIKGGQVKARADLKAEESAFFKPFISLPADADFSLRTDLTGHWADFEKIIFSPEGLPSTISGKVRGKLNSLNTPLPDPFEELVDQRGNLYARFHLHPDRSLKLNHFYAQNPSFSASGKGEFGGNLKFKEAEFTFHTQTIEIKSPFEISGEISGKGKLYESPEGLLLDLPFEVDSYISYHSMIEHSKGFLSINFSEMNGFTTLESELFGTGSFFTTKFQQQQNGWLFSDLQVDSSLAKGSADLFFTKQKRWIGNLDVEIEEIDVISNFYEPMNIFGTLDLHAQFSVEEQYNQLLDLQFIGSNVFYSGIYSESIEGDVHLDHLFDTPEGILTVSTLRSKYENLEFDVNVETSNEGENWPFSIRADGIWRDPMEFSASGYWRYKNDELLLNVQDIYGHIFTHPFNLHEPVQVFWKEDYLSLSETYLAFYTSSLRGKALFSKEKSDLEVSLESFPLDFLSLNPLDLSVHGSITLDLNIKEASDSTFGELDMTIEQVDIVAIADEHPLSATGTLTARLSDEVLQFKGDLHAREEEIIQCSAELPLNLNLMPWKMKWNKHKQIAATIHYDARLEEILDFINMGPHRLEGDLKCDLNISDNLARPCVQGSCELSSGVYENYYTGTFLEGIDAQLDAECKKIILKSLEANDGHEGSLSAKGQWDMRGDYPFSIEMEIDHLQCVELSFATALADGKIEVKGDRKSASARGTIEITRADLSIPDKIAKSVPTLPVTYVHAGSLHSTQIVAIDNDVSYPINLHLSIKAPKNIYVNGRGLYSEWKGNFHIGGTFSDVIPKGTLELLKGDFNFSGRSFDLTQGSLVFPGVSKELPQLSIIGKTTTQGIQIIAGLKGPLTTPHLTFRSIPSLPLGSILSYLIFGDDISTLNGFQALQLAAAVSSLSGEGPDVLEATRKTLGVDRLSIVSSPVGEGDDDKTAVQIGKYITKGVLVGVKQGADQDNYSSNLVVEVDLTHGWVFQGETQQEREQGKFTLKWNYNY